MHKIGLCPHVAKYLGKIEGEQPDIAPLPPNEALDLISMSRPFHIPTTSGITLMTPDVLACQHCAGVIHMVIMEASRTPGVALKLEGFNGPHDFSQVEKWLQQQHKDAGTSHPIEKHAAP